MVRFGYWTYKLNVEKVGFAWWSLLTGYLVLMGIGMISMAFEQRRSFDKMKKDGKETGGASEGGKEEGLEI